MLTEKKYKRIPQVTETAVEIYRMLPEGTRCEVIFNELVMSPSQTAVHQLLLSKLSYLLFSFLKQQNSGNTIISLLDVYLENEMSVVHPDFVIILKENFPRIHTDGIYGAPDAAIEILSQNKTYDTKRKRSLYEKAGVKEYFFIDPENKKTTLLTLNDAGVYEHAYDETGVLKSALLDCRITF